MAVFKDFLLDDGGDLLIQNGDFAIGRSDQQHVQDIINSYPGWWKQYPNVGVGVMNYLNSSGQQQKLQRNIIIQLQSDGYVVSNPIVDNNPDGTFTITPNAIRNE